MPELPEVEVVRRGLDRWVHGRTIDVVEVTGARSVRRHVEGAADFRARLSGATVLEARRRGKFLWLPLDTGEALVAHLGMSGQLLVQPSDDPAPRHLHVRVAFTDGGRDLRFVDQRTFGWLAVQEVRPEPAAPSDAAVVDDVPAAVSAIALDPLDPRFSTRAWVRDARRRRSGIKRVLLDQGAASGIGNIYADEALWRARLHYDRSAASIPPGRLADLMDHVREVMAEAVQQGGTSFDSLYVDVNGSSGYFERGLNAYGRAGRPCRRCGRPLVREPFMNRSSFRCTTCQPRPRPARRAP